MIFVPDYLMIFISDDLMNLSTAILISDDLMIFLLFSSYDLMIFVLEILKKTYFEYCTWHHCYLQRDIIFEIHTFWQESLIDRVVCFYFDDWTSLVISSCLCR
jgi:hypothetical protein